MNPLPPTELAVLQKAQEFLRSGNHVEARRNLQSLSPELEEHPDVLEASVEMHAQAAEWPAVLALSKRLCELVPDSEFAWMYQACSLNELQRVPEAFDVLCLAAEKLPKVPIIPYNLACLACKLNRLQDASRWIRRAAEVGGRAEVKLMALSDPDLEALLDEVCAL